MLNDIITLLWIAAGLLLLIGFAGLIISRMWGVIKAHLPHRSSSTEGEAS